MKKDVNVSPTLGVEGRTWFCLDCKTLVNVELMNCPLEGRLSTASCDCDLRLPEGQTTLEVVKE